MGADKDPSFCVLLNQIILENSLQFHNSIDQNIEIDSIITSGSPDNTNTREVSLGFKILGDSENDPSIQ